MGNGEPLKGAKRTKVHGQWLALRDAAVAFAEDNLDVAKDQVNRALEPFMWHTVIVSATEWENFLNLRDHGDASGPMQRIARMMREALWMSSPKPLEWGEWHLPLVGYFEYDIANLREPVKLPGGYVIYGALVSAGRCARSSYSHHRSPEGARHSKERWEGLAAKGHWSPGEHAAQLQASEIWHGNFQGWKQLRKFYPNEAIFKEV